MITKSTPYIDIDDEYVNLVMECCFDEQTPEATDLIAQIGKLIDSNQLNDVDSATVALLLRMSYMGNKLSLDTLKTAQSILTM